MKAKLMLCLCLLLAATTMFAQNLTVTGVVTEKATGYPAIGVSVLVKGTTNGTITSMDGDYTLSNVPKNATLAYIIHSGFISGYQNRYGDNLKPPTNVYHRMTA